MGIDGIGGGSLFTPSAPPVDAVQPAPAPVEPAAPPAPEAAPIRDTFEPAPVEAATRREGSPYDALRGVQDRTFALEGANDRLARAERETDARLANTGAGLTEAERAETRARALAEPRAAVERARADLIDYTARNAQVLARATDPSPANSLGPAAGGVLARATDAIKRGGPGGLQQLETSLAGRIPFIGQRVQAAARTLDGTARPGDAGILGGTAVSVGANFLGGPAAWAARGTGAALALGGQAVNERAERRATAEALEAGQVPADLARVLAQANPRILSALEERGASAQRIRDVARVAPGVLRAGNPQMLDAIARWPDLTPQRLQMLQSWQRVLQ
ncbi:MAG: hypothetical protein SFW67_13830 [Myxococcaceae bacterium]|nr:hypothetical protein [Myxococcaceae bacterium]